MLKIGETDFEQSSIAHCYTDEISPPSSIPSPLVWAPDFAVFPYDLLFAFSEDVFCKYGRIFLRIFASIVRWKPYRFPDSAVVL